MLFIKFLLNSRKRLIRVVPVIVEYKEQNTGLYSHADK